MSNSNEAMREALAMLVDACDSFHQFIENGLDGNYDAIPRYFSGEDDFLRCVNAAKAALAAPPRQCDMLSADQCKRIFKSELEIYLTKEATDRDRYIALGTAYGLIDSLFAPYTERKGEGE